MFIQKKFEVEAKSAIRKHAFSRRSINFNNHLSSFINFQKGDFTPMKEYLTSKTTGLIFVGYDIPNPLYLCNNDWLTHLNQSIIKNDSFWQH